MKKETLADLQCWSGQEPRRDASAAACAHTLSRAVTSLGSSPANEIHKTMCTPRHQYITTGVMQRKKKLS
jgi:hypothetical protein